MLTGPSPLSLAAPALQPGGARAPLQAFSYDDAVAALERRSARSLEIHGGRPETDLTAEPGAEGARAGTQQPEAPAPASSNSDPVAPAAAQAPAATKAAARPVLPSAPATVLPALSAPAPTLTPAAAPAPSPLPAAGAVAAREGAARLKADAAPSPVLQRAQPGAVRQFAEILAQRLDSASQFDIRLDPPALGSVEGRLTLSDDGRARLALTFDNQPAFDLFRRDETALRSALADAGFDLSGRSLHFSFREPSRDEPPGRGADQAGFPATARPLHRGVIDIRA